MRKHLRIQKIDETVHALVSGTEVPSKEVCSVNLLGSVLPTHEDKGSQRKTRVESQRQKNRGKGQRAEHRSAQIAEKIDAKFN